MAFQGHHLPVFSEHDDDIAVLNHLKPPTKRSKKFVQNTLLSHGYNFTINKDNGKIPSSPSTGVLLVPTSKAGIFQILKPVNNTTVTAPSVIAPVGNISAVGNDCVTSGTWSNLTASANGATVPARNNSTIPAYSTATVAGNIATASSHDTATLIDNNSAASVYSTAAGNNSTAITYGTSTPVWTNSSASAHDAASPAWNSSTTPTYSTLLSAGNISTTATQVWSNSSVSAQGAATVVGNNLAAPSGNDLAASDHGIMIPAEKSAVAYDAVMPFENNSTESTIGMIAPGGSIPTLTTYSAATPVWSNSTPAEDNSTASAYSTTVPAGDNSASNTYSTATQVWSNSIASTHGVASADGSYSTSSVCTIAPAKNNAGVSSCSTTIPAENISTYDAIMPFMMDSTGPALSMTTPAGNISTLVTCSAATPVSSNSTPAHDASTSAEGYPTAFAYSTTTPHENNSAAYVHSTTQDGSILTSVPYGATTPVCNNLTFVHVAASATGNNSTASDHNVLKANSLNKFMQGRPIPQPTTKHNKAETISRRATKSKKDATKPINGQKVPTVYFDVETGGLCVGVDILQFGAVWEDKSIMQYITPTMPVSPGASNINGLVMEDRYLAKVVTKHPYVTEKLESLPIKDALENFMLWLEDIGPCYLVGHNIKFDKRHLLYQTKQCRLTRQMNKLILGYIDTLPMFRSLYPSFGYGNYKQETLVRKLLKNDTENLKAHDALSDVLLLQKLVKTSKASYDTLLRFMVTKRTR